MLTKNNIFPLSDEAKKRPAFWFFWVSRLRGFAVGALGLVGLRAFVRGLFVGGMV